MTFMERGVDMFGKPSPAVGHDVFVYCPKDGTTWQVLRGIIGGKCVSVDEGLPTIIKSEAEERARNYCKKWGDTYKGIVDANEFETDTTEII